MNTQESVQQNNNNSQGGQNSLPYLVLGAGLTGLSCLRYLDHKGETVKVYDDQLNDTKRAQINAISKDIPTYDGNNDLEKVLEGIGALLVSPGVSHQHPLVCQAKQKQINMFGDIEIFAQQNFKPVIAVTGSNGKSTVVTLLELMAKEQGITVSLAGNIGRPLLDSVLEDDAQLYVLELSSFQLDITESLRASVACILNVSPDHLDRYDSYADYAKAKQKIYQGANSIIYNRDDVLSESTFLDYKTISSFGMNTAEQGHFGISFFEKTLFLCFGDTPIIAVKDCKKNNQADIQNALAAMAIANAAGISFQAICAVLKQFTGLPHRCELVAQGKGVTWINDSKGTNVGATETALNSIASDIESSYEGHNAEADSVSPSIILIAGGDSKGGDLSQLLDTVKSKVKAILIIGQDSVLFQEVFQSVVPCKVFHSLKECVEYAANLSRQGDTVLLSPACASQDMFKNYQDRGDQFKKLVIAAVDGGES